MNYFKYAIILLLLTDIFLLYDAIGGLRRINKDTKHRNLAIAWYVAGLIIAIVSFTALILEALGIFSW